LKDTGGQTGNGADQRHPDPNPGVNAMKLFYSPRMLTTKNFVPGDTFQSSLIFMNEDRFYPSGALKVSLETNMRLSSKVLPKTRVHQ